MLKWLIRNRITAFEKKFGYDASYMREILDADTRAFCKFARVQGISEWRRDIPAAEYYAAKIVSVLSEDCGPCTQLVVGMALAEKVDGAVIAAVLEGRDDDLPEGPRRAVRFARACLAHDPAAAELREQILAAHGPRAIVSLAFAILSGRIYPTIKYALGHGIACQRISIGTSSIVPKRAA